MARTQLRVYYGPEDDTATATVAEPQTASPKVTVPLSDIVSALADAVQHQRGWLKDFEDEEITVSATYGA